MGYVIFLIELNHFGVGQVSYHYYLGVLHLIDLGQQSICLTLAMLTLRAEYHEYDGLAFLQVVAGKSSAIRGLIHGELRYHRILKVRRRCTIGLAKNGGITNKE